MYARDRLASLALFAAAAVAWGAVGAVVTTRYPDSTEIRLAVAGLLGLALALTCVPLFWLGVFTRHHRIAHRGDWPRAARRGLLAGAVAAILIVLRVQGVLSLPIVVFVVVLVVFAEVSLTVRR